MTFKRIDVKQCEALLENSTTTVLDIRDVQSYQKSHIDGALSAKDIPAFVSSADKTAPLIVCCYHGNTSQQAAEHFSTQGFNEVYSLDGGYEAWENK